MAMEAVAALALARWRRGRGTGSGSAVDDPVGYQPGALHDFPLAYRLSVGEVEPATDRHYN